MLKGADMEYLKTSFLVVFPLFLKLALGYVLKQTKLMSERSFKEMNNVIFRSFFPHCCSDIYRPTLKGRLGKVDRLACSSLVVLFIIAMIIVPFEKENRKRRVLVWHQPQQLHLVQIRWPLRSTERKAGRRLDLVGGRPLINTLSVIALEYFGALNRVSRRSSKESSATRSSLVPSRFGARHLQSQTSLHHRKVLR